MTGPGTRPFYRMVTTTNSTTNRYHNCMRYSRAIFFLCIPKKPTNGFCLNFKFLHAVYLKRFKWLTKKYFRHGTIERACYRM